MIIDPSTARDELDLYLSLFGPLWFRFHRRALAYWADLRPERRQRVTHLRDLLGQFSGETIAYPSDVVQQLRRTFGSTPRIPITFGRALLEECRAAVRAEFPMIRIPRDLEFHWNPSESESLQIVRYRDWNDTRDLGIAHTLGLTYDGLRKHLNEISALKHTLNPRWATKW